MVEGIRDGGETVSGSNVAREEHFLAVGPNLRSAITWTTLYLVSCMHFQLHDFKLSEDDFAGILDSTSSATLF